MAVKHSILEEFHFPEEIGSRIACSYAAFSVV